MATIKSNSKFLTVTIRNKVTVFNFESQTVRNLQCSTKSCANDKSNIGTLDETVFLPCSDISICGNWFMFSFKKCLSLYNTRDWSLVNCGVLQRSPSKIKFSSDGSKVIVADKGGDVYIFSRDNVSLPGSLLLGHLSVLFDVIFSKDEKFIISCDRDEKIRVSCYPNAYNINSYCLGHDEFVTSLNLVPHCHNILISTSGDRTLRFWHFKIGKEILKYNCSSDIDELYVEYDDDVPLIENIAVIKCEVFQIDECESIACLIFNNYQGCLVYSIKGINNNITCEKVQNISLSNVPCDICIAGKILWFLTSKDKFILGALQWIVAKNQFEAVNENVNNAVTIMNNHLCEFECKFKSKICYIYKKQFQTVDEYHKRKNNKMHETSKKNRKLPE